MENRNAERRYDSRLERRLKRRSVSNQSYKQNPRKRALKGTEKIQGIAVIDLEEEPGEYRACGFESDAVGTAEDGHSVGFEDLDYNMFLQNLKEDGNSYALVLFNDNGDPEVIRYDTGDYVPKSDENLAANRKRKGERISREVSAGAEAEVSTGWVSNLIRRASRCRARNVKKEKKKRVLEASGGEPIRREKSFLGSGRGLFVESKRDSVEEEGFRCGGPVERGRDRRCEDEDDKEYGGILQKHIGDENSEYEKIISRFEDVMTRGKSDDPGPSMYGDCFVERGVGGDWDDRSSKREYSNESEFDDVDEDYSAFVALLAMGVEDESNEAEDSDSDSDLIVLDEDLHINGNSTPFVPSRPQPVIDLEADIPGGDPTARRSEFMTELLEVLKMPYDSEQHEELEREVKCRKPIIEDRNLRGKTKSYPSANKLGKSYLANFTDFAKAFDLAKNDDLKSFNLLRGFFFWLKNISRDGAFRPWEYAALFEAKPKKQLEGFSASSHHRKRV